MIIADKWRPIQNWRIDLEAWLRAPLYLSNGVRLFAAIDSETACRRYPEIVVTDIPPGYWADLWRIEIDIVDGVGATYLLLDLLAQRRIEILRSEGSVSSFNDFYTMSVVVCARRYDGDDDVRDRIAHRETRLSALFAEILIYFGDQIAIDHDGRPRLKVSRMTPYLVLQEELTSGYRQLLDPNGFVLDGGSFALATPASKRLVTAAVGAGASPPRQSLTHDSGILYTAAVDTKSRFLRILLCPEEGGGLHHMQIFLQGSPSCLAHIFGTLKRVGANVLRYQLRPMPEVTAVAKFGDGQHEAHKLDLTFEFNAVKADKIADKLETISTAIPALTFVDGQILVSWSSWGNEDAIVRNKAAKPTEKRVRKEARADIAPKQKGKGRQEPRSAGDRRGAPKGGSESV